jgi:hypothetical protein
VLFLNGKGRAIELVLSSRSLRYARVVYTMEGKGSAVPERELLCLSEFNNDLLSPVFPFTHTHTHSTQRYKMYVLIKSQGIAYMDYDRAMS